MSAHTHDNIDWSARLSAMRRLDSLEHDALAAVATRLAGTLPPDTVVVDVGCGTGGMGAALAHVLARNGGGTVVLVDATERLLAAAGEAVAAAGGPRVRVKTVITDLDAAPLREHVGEADLVWAASVLHHLPDQQAAVDGLASALTRGGLLAVAEGGLDQRFLPWDTGVGRPGLEQRLNAARDDWFGELRATMPGAVPMPYGWTTALRRAGLADVDSFSFLVEHAAPAGEHVLDYVVERLTWLAETVGDRIDEEDRDTLRRLLDPGGEDFLRRRGDVFLLNARTVHTARRP